MKKIFGMMILIVGIMLVFGFTACDPDDPGDDGNPPPSDTQEDGVIINGVKWATRNVNTPGTFTATSNDLGMFYRWNLRTAWSSTDPMTSSPAGVNWDSETTGQGTVWSTANDPSPSGWRIPTKDELNSLLDTANVTRTWRGKSGTQNAGMTFTDKTSGNSIFLPAAGMRYFSPPGELNNVNTTSNYWSITQGTVVNTNAFSLLINTAALVKLDEFAKSFAFSIRPVATSQ